MSVGHPVVAIDQHGNTHHIIEVTHRDRQMVLRMRQTPHPYVPGIDPF